MNITEITALFKKIKRFYPGFDASSEHAKRCERYLLDIPLSLAITNLDRHIMAERFPPTIAEIRGHAGEDPLQKHLREESESYFAQVDLWKQTAAPPPTGLKERIHSMLHGGTDHDG